MYKLYGAAAILGLFLSLAGYSYYAHGKISRQADKIDEWSSSYEDLAQSYAKFKAETKAKQERDERITYEQRQTIKTLKEVKGDKCADSIIPDDIADLVFKHPT